MSFPVDVLTDGDPGTSPPVSPASGDWGAIDNFIGGVTVSKPVNFAALISPALLDFNGDYTALTVDDTTIGLSNPSLISPAWANLGDSTPYADIILSTSGIAWVGPFVLDLDDLTTVIANFECQQGLYLIDKKGHQRANSVSVELEITPVDQDNNPSGPAETFVASVDGSDTTTKSRRAVTLTANPTFTGRCQVRARRTSPTDLNYNGTVVDEVRWTGCFGLARVAVDDFGDVTLAHVRTYATSGATSVKDRKLNCQATRKIPQRDGDGFTTELFASDRADDIICAMALDPFIGRLDLPDLDLDDIYAAIQAIEDHFGTGDAVKFGYTFDDDQISFEESANIVATAAFSQPYRVGSILRLKPELPQQSSILLFNHRNVLPGSMKRTVRFGIDDQNDGVEVTYADPKDGTPLTLRVPTNYPTAPRKVELPGVRIEAQASWHAWRLYNKLAYQNTTVEFVATEESRMLARNDRILVTDQNRQPGVGGDLVDYDAATQIVTLDKAATLDAGTDYVIYFTSPSGFVEVIPISTTADPRAIQLQGPPTVPPVVDPAAAVRTIYAIAPTSGDARQRPFLLTQRTYQGRFTETLQAINYDDRYYESDKILVDDSGPLIDDNGTLTED